MKQQTAVDWYRQEIMKVLFASDNNTNIYENDIHEQAKAMEQQQIENAWVDAKISMISKEIKNAEEYYKEKYENL